MAVYSFSIKDAKVDDIMVIDTLRIKCKRDGRSFSNEIVKAIIAYEQSKETKSDKGRT